MSLFFAAAVFGIFFAPVLTGLLSILANRRAGELGRQRALLRGGLFIGLCRAFVNSVWTLWLTVLVLPCGKLPFANYRGAGCRRGGGLFKRPPVILVHGLYHNPAAWLVMRWRLARAGYGNVWCYGYPSFGREFADIAAGLAELMLEAAQDTPDRRVLLLGHSLGGLVIRAACADPRIAGGGRCRVAAVVTLGTPHRGSTLAGLLGLGRLARGLTPEGEVLRLMRGLPACPLRALSLFTPTDGMVLPLSGSFLEERERASGWRERMLPATSHVGLLYSGAAAREALAFLESAEES